MGTRRESEARPAVKLTCPKCGLSAEGVRCARCNALKVSGCDGACTACRKGKACG